MKSKHLVIVIVAIWSAFGMANSAFSAQGAIEEIIVTAERRAESLQSVPVAITAFTGEEMDAQGIVDIKGITERTPGFTMGVFNPGQPQFYIRGIGSNEDGAGGDQSVIVFIDEVYIGRSAGSDFDLFDLERVEVLRGPQGTLFGKNVIGGAVSLITKKPTEETVMKFEGTVGSLDETTVRGLVSGEIAENVYGKVSFSSRRRDGRGPGLLGSRPDLRLPGNRLPTPGKGGQDWRRRRHHPLPPRRHALRRHRTQPTVIRGEGHA